MVQITGYKTTVNKDGEEFVRLEVQGDVTPVRSKASGKIYLTSKKAYIACTYDELTAQALIGSSLPGTVDKVFCDPYEYTIKDTGETITKDYRYEYVMEEDIVPKHDTTNEVVSASELMYLEEHDQSGEIVV